MLSTQVVVKAGVFIGGGTNYMVFLIEQTFSDSYWCRYLHQPIIRDWQTYPAQGFDHLAQGFDQLVLSGVRMCHKVQVNREGRFLFVYYGILFATYISHPWSYCTTKFDM